MTVSSGVDSLVPVLMYHEVSRGHPAKGETHHLTPLYDLPVATFEAQMEWLRVHGYHAVGLDRVASVGKPVVITFDDGLVGNFTQALPALRGCGFTATIFVATGSVGAPHFMSWSQLAELARAGMSIQSHTVSHQPLETLPKDAIWRELVESKAVLEERLQRRVTALSFPHGSYSRGIAEMAAKAGYDTLCTSEARYNRIAAFSDNPAVVGRVAITTRTSMEGFARCVACDPWEIRRLRVAKAAKNSLKRMIGIENYRRFYRRYFNVAPPAGSS